MLPPSTASLAQAHTSVNEGPIQQALAALNVSPIVLREIARSAAEDAEAQWEGVLKDCGIPEGHRRVVLNSMRNELH
jgi:hypothetical protein